MRLFVWWLIGGVLVVHGLIHLVLAMVPDPRAGKDAPLWGYFGAEGRSWVLPNVGMDPAAIRTLAMILVAFATAGFVLAGLAFLFHVGVWRGLTVFAAGASVVLLVLFWQTELWFGTSLSLAALLLALFWVRLPLAGPTLSG